MYISARFLLDALNPFINHSLSACYQWLGLAEQAASGRFQAQVWS